LTIDSIFNKIKVQEAKVKKIKGKYFIIIFMGILIIMLNGCDLGYERFDVHIKIDSIDKVSCKFTFFNIGSKNMKLEKELEELKKIYIEGTSIEDIMEALCSSMQFKMKKFWVDDGSLNAVFLFEFPGSDSFLNSLKGNELGFLKLDEDGNYYLPVELKQNGILYTNGRIRKIGTNIKSIDWSSKSKEIYYSLSMKNEYILFSLSEVFFMEYGPSKTIR
jgi:hypothetical protein